MFNGNDFLPANALPQAPAAQQRTASLLCTCFNWPKQDKRAITPPPPEGRWLGQVPHGLGLIAAANSVASPTAPLREGRASVRPADCSGKGVDHPRASGAFVMSERTPWASIARSAPSLGRVRSGVVVSAPPLARRGRALLVTPNNLTLLAIRVLNIIAALGLMATCPFAISPPSPLSEYLHQVAHKYRVMYDLSSALSHSSP